MAREAGTRERIIDAARAVMLNKGLVRATTKEIARAAGVSEGTIYNYFANKEELIPLHPDAIAVRVCHAHARAS